MQIILHFSQLHYSLSAYNIAKLTVHIKVVIGILWCYTQDKFLQIKKTIKAYTHEENKKVEILANNIITGENNNIHYIFIAKDKI